MRTNCKNVPAGAELLRSDSDGIPYEWDYDINLYTDNTNWYVEYMTSTGTCEVCGGETYDVDMFDNLQEANAYYNECLSKEWW